jgi:hypothetical protein
MGINRIWKLLDSIKVTKGNDTSQIKNHPPDQLRWMELESDPKTLNTKKTQVIYFNKILISILSLRT